MTWPNAPVTERCICGHLKSEHRIDLKTASCGRGCEVPGLACDCNSYRDEESK